MNLKKTIFLLIALAIQTLAFSQAEINQGNEKITDVLTEYFKLDRENIHLHLNKNTFLTSDEIWFKGYIIEKKSKKPYLPTSNVHINLIDANGTKIKTYLFFADNSIFEGNIKLDENISTGTYYLQVYTNYMNNFAEDESSVYKLSIINPTDGKSIPDTKKVNPNTITTEFFPEGNVFLEGTSNTIAIKITDCNGNGIVVKDGEVINPQGVTITNFSTNELGYGKFEIMQTKNELYKAVFKINETKTEKILPMPEAKGITFSANNYTFENKTTLKVKTNANSLAEYKNEPLKFVIQQDDYSSYVPFSFKENSTEQLLALPSENFMNGINAIYLVDKNNKKIAERLIYKPLKFDRNIDLKVLKKQNDSIVLSGTSTILMGTLSISVLPNETKSLSGNRTMYNSFLLDNQLDGKSPDGNILLSNFSKRKHYELDTYLMCQKSKYNWQSMLSTTPKEKFEFDNGLTIKGTLNVPPKDKESKVNMTSFTSGLNLLSTLNEKNEFYFKNIIVSDSTLVHYSLLDKKGNHTEIKLATQILNNNRTFIKPFKNVVKECPSIAEDNVTTDYSFPKIANTVQLDSISIETKSKGPKLVNANRFGNAMSKGFKIADRDSSRDILQFIAANGYDVTQNGSNVIIVGRRSTSFYGTKSPLIYMDDVPVTDFNLLLGYSLRYVDEVYINKSGYGGGLGASNGIIRIYTKKTFGTPSKIRVNSQSVLVKDGFEKTKQFVNPKYTSFTNAGFLDFGTIHWEPYVATDENGIFRFAIPNYYVKSVKVVIEGIASDGQIISETKIIEIP